MIDEHEPIDLSKLPEGPWKAVGHHQYNEDGLVVAANHCNSSIISCSSPGADSAQRNEMARLCAASPELLAEVRAWRSHHECKDDQVSAALDYDWAAMDAEGKRLDALWAQAQAARAATDAKGVV